MGTGIKTPSLLRVNQRVRDVDLEPYSTGVVLSVEPTIVRFGAMKVKYTTEEQLKYLTVIDTTNPDLGVSKFTVDRFDFAKPY